MNVKNQSMTDIIRRRFSCRHYLEQPIGGDKRQQLQIFINALPAGPFGSHPRLILATSTEQDRSSLRGLGTYGFIRNPAGFIIGAAKPDGKWLEDFGFQMESIILHATWLELGTCWLGGSFTRSSFSEKISPLESEQIPAAVAIGEFVDSEQSRKNLIRRIAKGEKRLPWRQLFFDKDFSHPIEMPFEDKSSIGLEMVRLAPSASNKQPWRVIKDGNVFHFYLQRTPGYKDSLLKRALGIVDLQRVDMGIAMCHFDLTMKELGRQGNWVTQKPTIKKPNELVEYTVSYITDIGSL